MDGRDILLGPARVLVLTIVLFGVLMGSLIAVERMGAGAPPGTDDSVAVESAMPGGDGGGAPAASPAEQAVMAILFLGACALQAGAFVFIIRRSRWSGWRLVLMVFVLLFGVTAVMSQVETAFFVRGAVRSGAVSRMLMAQGLAAAVFAPMAALVCGRLVHHRPAPVSARWRMSARDWAWTAPVLILAYVALYMVAGYFFVWLDPEARAFYGGAAPESFFAHMGDLARSHLSIFALQTARGALWIGFAWLVVRMWGAGRVSLCIGLVLLFAVAFPALLLPPNPIMPREARVAHLLETATSNAAFAVLAGALLTRRRATVVSASPERAS